MAAPGRPMREQIEAAREALRQASFSPFQTDNITVSLEDGIANVYDSGRLVMMLPEGTYNDLRVAQ